MLHHELLKYPLRPESALEFDDYACWDGNFPQKKHVEKWRYAVAKAADEK